MGIISDIADVAGAISKVKDVITTFNQARSVILEIDNNTDLKLTKASENHDHGGWAETPTGEIPPHKALVFGSQSSAWSVATGTEGSITYAGDGIQLKAYWDDPFIGSNSCDLQLTGPNAKNYRINKECGVGNTQARMRYELFFAPVGPTAQGTIMHPNEVLDADRPIHSANGLYTFVFQGDGNLVLYKNTSNKDRIALWASGTNGKVPVGVCVMQGDGNLVIYDTYRTPLWASGTSTSPDSQLVVQDDGNVVIYQPDGKPVWSTHTSAPVGPIAQGSIMHPNDLLGVDRPIHSANGLYTFVFQGDGNLVLYKNTSDRSRIALWASGTNGKGPVGVCIMQGDDNLVIYDDYRKPIWSSKTSGSSGSQLVVQDDGNVVIYRTDRKPVWATNTMQSK